jgi:hypothetical protein
MAVFLKDITVKGVIYKVEIDGDGSFIASPKGKAVMRDDLIVAPSLDKLESKIAARIRRTGKVSIPFCYFNGSGWISDEKGRVITGVIEGLHAGNANLLIKVGGKRDQLSKGKTVFPPECAKELARLHKAVVDTRKALDAFNKTHAFDAEARIEELLSKQET